MGFREIETFKRSVGRLISGSDISGVRGQSGEKKINFMHMIYLSIVRKLHAKLGTQENDPAG